ncbi:MAG: tetratricopeptide repeat protein, partial [Phycisphaerae bacterium]
VVVIDKAGHVVLARAGMTPQFSDNLSDALLYAAGKLSLEQYELTLHPKAQPAANESDPAVKAGRIAGLAQQLARRGLDDMAAEKYAEALQLDPKQPGAHLGFGMLQLKRGKLAEAEVQFKLLLEQDPKSLEAKLGLAFVQTSRGGGELDLAEQSVREILVANPTLARGHYLLGLIAQQRKKPEEAAQSFKKAAEILMDQVPQETTP